MNTKEQLVPVLSEVFGEELAPDVTLDGILDAAARAVVRAGSDTWDSVVEKRPEYSKVPEEVAELLRTAAGGLVVGAHLRARLAAELAESPELTPEVARAVDELTMLFGAGRN